MHKEDTWWCVCSALPLTHSKGLVAWGPNGLEPNVNQSINQWPTRTPTASKRSGPHYMNSDSELHTAQRHYETLCTSCFTKLHHPLPGHGIRRVGKSCSASIVMVLLLSESNIVNYFPTGRRNNCRPLKRLLDAWDRNGSTSGPTPWKIDDDDIHYINQ